MVHAHALAAYAPARSQLPVVYLRAREQNEVLEPHAERWWMDHTDGAFSMHTVPGDHFTMMEPPHAGAVARLVSQHLIGEGRVGPEYNKVPSHDPSGSSLVSQPSARSGGNGNL